MTSIQKFCNKKTIAIIGNSSRILQSNYGSIIDAHDIVVRINNAPRYINRYSKNVGTKTTIISYGLSRLDLARQISKLCNPQYTLFLIRCNGEIQNYQEYASFKNPCHGDIEEYRQLKAKFNEFKPSTGSVTINYFIKNINFAKLNLYGFDFFNSSSKIKRNEFGSYMYKDHSGQYERQYINSILSDKVIINY